MEYANELKLEIGNETLYLFHDRGETDDATWVWLPQRKTICTGDLFIWSCMIKFAVINDNGLTNYVLVPNCGNPQKSQRYCLEWATALRKMENLNAELILPGHGPPIRSLL